MLCLPVILIQLSQWVFYFQFSFQFVRPGPDLTRETTPVADSVQFAAAFRFSAATATSDRSSHLISVIAAPTASSFCPGLPSPPPPPPALQARARAIVD